MADPESPSLYERLGGAPALDDIVRRFYDRILADPELAPFFATASMDALRRMQAEFFGVALEGPVTYSGRPIRHVHHGRGITRHHFRRFIGHLIDTLEERGVGADDLDAVISRIAVYADQVTGGAGEAG